MALDITSIPRVIKYKNDILTDVPGMPVDKVVQMSSHKYPELINCKVHGPTIEDKDGEKTAVYTVNESSGTKG